MILKRNIKNLAVKVACATLLKPVMITSIPSSAKTIRCARDQVSMLTDSTNNVIRVALHGKVYFFRECKKRLKIEDFVREQVDCYYDCCGRGHHDEKNAVLASLADKRNLSRFADMGMTNDLHSGAYRFCMYGSGKDVGLEIENTEQIEHLKDLVQFVWGDLYAYMLNNGLRKGCYQTYNAVRSIATYRMARLLGLERLIPRTEYAKLCIDDATPLFGTIMDCALGVCLEQSTPDERSKMVSPMLQRDLMNLNCLDAICTERDHRLGNYNVVLENGIAQGIAAFDNDSPRSFSLGGISFATYKGCAPIVKGNKFNRPFVDAAFAEKLNHLTYKLVRDEMCDLLNVWQIAALWRRIKKLDKILMRVPGRAKLGESDWSSDTIKEEISGKFGKTYLMHFVEKQDLLYQPWIKQH